MPKSKHRARSLLFRAPFSVFYSQGPARTSSDSRCLSYGIGGIGGPELSCKVEYTFETTGRCYTHHQSILPRMIIQLSSCIEKPSRRKSIIFTTRLTTRGSLKDFITVALKRSRISFQNIQ
ncbi:Hypothetical protein CINCED_3A006202 [Cinara cedri]|uniref:Uncharacterized protein n=1 Tax=Cinara cedri TaxID=506608 RepID=A0A5E4MH54_9HEMI|nr:Hypothetical protein CINCED_3A006202 [Cinara cedri]